MDKEIQKELLNKSSHFINDASRVLGQTTSHVYSVLIKQQIIEGIGTIFSSILFSIVFGMILKWYYGFVKRNWDRSDDFNFGIILFGMFALLLTALLLGVVIGQLSEAIQKIINPEFYVIKFIFDSIHK